MKKIFIALAVSILLLTGCQSSSEGSQFQIDVSQVEQGGVIEVDGFAINQYVLEDKINIAFLIGVDGCAACTTAKSDVNSYAFYNKMIVYYVSITGITIEEYSALRLVTVEYGEPAKELPALVEDSVTIAFPMMFIFYQGVGLAFANESFTVTLDRYINVLPLDA